ncbi:MAG: hypothetical protein JSW48_12695 [Betaproteobacteria bacterium]|jgi:hypothetical protein|nr:MAG: hypothetical protein JSW48_12695 [Betaproteobacteria bacterium]
MVTPRLLCGCGDTARHPACQTRSVDPDATVVTPEKRQGIEKLIKAKGALNIAKLMSEAVTRQMSTAIILARPNIPVAAIGIANDETNRVISEQWLRDADSSA